MHRTHTDRQLGFTLGETLAALAVTGIGLSLAVPGLQSLTRSNGQAAAVNQLVTTMHFARSEAIMRNRPVSVCASASGTGCDSHDWSDGWIAFVDEDGNQQRAPAEALVEQAPAPGLSLASAQFASAFGFAADGRTSGPRREVASGEFAFCAAGATTAGRVVILRASGLPTLADRGRDGAPLGCPGRTED
ncbi:MAG: GspH/FimT family pseudopilin [Gammaproteobacteria bacterium]